MKESSSASLSFSFSSLILFLSFSFFSPYLLFFFRARCSFSHGSKEQLYHPSYYKTMPCIDYRPQSASGGVDTKGGSSSSSNHNKGASHSHLHSAGQRNGGGLVLTSIGGCPRGFLCAFYHDVSERRLPSPPPLPQFSYTQPLPIGQLKFLQPLFLQPPLFNLDDFEAFGHQR